MLHRGSWPFNWWGHSHHSTWQQRVCLLWVTESKMIVLEKSSPNKDIPSGGIVVRLHGSKAVSLEHRAWVVIDKCLQTVQARRGGLREGAPITWKKTWSYQWISQKTISHSILVGIKLSYIPSPPRLHGEPWWLEQSSHLGRDDACKKEKPTWPSSHLSPQLEANVCYC